MMTLREWMRNVVESNKDNPDLQQALAGPVVTPSREMIDSDDAEVHHVMFFTGITGPHWVIYQGIGSVLCTMQPDPQHSDTLVSDFRVLPLPGPGIEARVEYLEHVASSNGMMLINPGALQAK